MVEKRRGGMAILLMQGRRGKAHTFMHAYQPSLIKELTSSLPHHLAIFPVHISKPANLARSFVKVKHCLRADVSYFLCCKRKRK